MASSCPDSGRKALKYVCVLTFGHLVGDQKLLYRGAPIKVKPCDMRHVERESWYACFEIIDNFPCLVHYIGASSWQTVS